jgi:hypothetical protein
MKKTLVILIVVVAIPSLGIAGFIGYDILQDRQHILVTEGPVPAYPDWERYPPSGMKPGFVIPPDTTLRVKRIRYGKDYMAVRVQSEKGETGWVFYGSGFKIKKGHITS